MGGFNSIFPSSGYKNKILSYPVLLLLLFIEFIFIFLWYNGPTYDLDTPSYIAAVNQIWNGELDVFRTPIYPWFIGLFNLIFKDSGEIALVIFQLIVFLFSCKYLYKLSKYIVKKDKCIFWVLAIYMLYPAFIQYTLFILTESLSISVTIFFIYTSVKLLFYRNNILGFLLPSIWLLFLIFLRPIFICILPLLLIFYIYVIKKEGRSKMCITTLLGGFLFIIGIIVWYQISITLKFGIHSISSVTLMNNYHSLRYMGIIDPTLAPTPELRREVEATIPARFNEKSETYWHEFERMTSVSNLKDIETYEKRTISHYKKDYIESIVHRWVWKARMYPILPGIYFNWKISFLNTFIPDLGFYWLFLTSYLIFLIMVFIKKRTLMVPEIFLTLFCLSIFITSVIGAMSEYTRLNLPAMPAFFILLAGVISHINCKSLIRKSSICPHI